MEPISIKLYNVVKKNPTRRFLVKLKYDKLVEVPKKLILFAIDKKPVAHLSLKLYNIVE